MLLIARKPTTWVELKTRLPRVLVGRQGKRLNRGFGRAIQTTLAIGKPSVRITWWTSKGRRRRLFCRVHAQQLEKRVAFRRVMQ